MTTLRILALLVMVVGLQGCLTHWVVDGEIRLQMENRAAVPVADLAIVANSGSRAVLVPDTLAPGEKSDVYSGDWVGEFHLGLSARDSVDALGDTCWRFVDLGVRTLEGGSSLARIRHSVDGWSLELK